MFNRRTIFLYLSLILFWIAPGPAIPAEVISFTDDAGRPVTLPPHPVRIVSHAPMATDILQALEAHEKVSADGEIRLYDPSRGPGKVLGEANGIAIQTGEIAHALAWIPRLGALTGRGEQARRLVEEIRSDLAVAAAKTASLTPTQRLSMLGVRMENGQLAPMTGARQADLIARAGGRSALMDPANTRGEVLKCSDAQLIFAAYEQRQAVLDALKAPQWARLNAVQNRQVYFFPAHLLDNSLSAAGYLINAMASRAYPELYTDPSLQVRPDRVFRTRRVPIDLAMVAGARICHHYRYEFRTKTLVVDLKAPQKILSTLEGMRTGITTVGNHYAAPPCWWLDPHSGLETLQKHVLPVIERPAATTSLLFTGADMDHLAVETARFRDMQVVALVTAGVRGNAVRLSRDKGNYYEPGTINIILMSNLRLSERAMSRALITATEAKTAALWDLDIRSSYTPRRHAATGTGTDNLIVVQNSAAETTIDNSGGHTKMGQLMATAVYGGVRRAIARQNGLTANRGVIARLAERWIEIDRLVANTALPEGLTPGELTADIRQELRRPEVEDLLTAAMSLDDAAGRGLTRISAGFEEWCRRVAAHIAGRPLAQLPPHMEIGPEAPALSLALNAVWNGVLTQLDAPATQAQGTEKKSD